MIRNYTIHIPKNIELLYLDCYRTRCYQISQLFTPGDIFFFNTDWINNDFQKNLVDPIILYITMLPNNFFSENSVLKLEILHNSIQLTIYSNYDSISGLNPDKILLKKLNINILDKFTLNNYKICSPDTYDKINNLRIKKDLWELIQINDAIEKTFSSFIAMREILTLPNLNEANIEAIFMKTILDNQFTIAYLPICAGDSNGAFIHYSKNNSKVQNNILLDCGGRNPYGYCADITRSYMIQNNELFTKVYDIVNECKVALENNIENTLKNGELPNFNRLNYLCIDTFIRLLPKILPDSIQVNNDIVNLFYTHFIGHHVGLNVHDIHSNNLELGSVFTLEPGLYFNKDLIKININPELFKLGGIRIEDMYYITPEMELVCLTSHI